MRLRRIRVACGSAWCSSAPRFHALNSRGQLRLIAIALWSAVMTKQREVCRRSASRQLHKEVALHPRNSSTTFAKALGVGGPTIYRIALLLPRAPNGLSHTVVRY